MTRPIRRRALAAALALLAGAAVVYALWPDGDTTLAAAQAAADRRDFAHALALLDGSLDAARPDPDALLLGARAARRAGQPALANRYLRRYLERDGDGEVAAIERVLGWVQRGEMTTFDGGLKFCAEHPDHPEVPFILEAMTQGYLKAGHVVRAADTATRWLATNPPPADKAQAYVWRGECYRFIGNLDPALADARAALALAPDFADAHMLAAEALTGSDPDAALTHYAAVLAKESSRVEARVGSARARRNRGEPDLARAELDAVLAAHPDHLAARVERARLLLDARDYAAAERDLQHALARAPRSRDALATLARMYQLTGRDAEAAKTRQAVKAIEEELFKLIEHRVAAGMIPAPPPGTDLTAPPAP